MLTPKVEALAFDCNDLDAMAAFWGGLLGMKVTFKDENWLDLEPLGKDGPMLSFQRVPEGKQGKNRLHLDLEVPDIDAAGEIVRGLGGTPAGERTGRPEHPFRVWRDVEGNEFCLVSQ
ncbi:VOC family protein [Spirillospora sp. CA-294931]|uniref:VOC family protein n=1 Tax=Spirillospora sp. CA-294931 TaxID=3240042 RepID=UPI003D94D184